MTDDAAAPMPPGWTIELLRERSGDRTACALPLDLQVTDATGPVHESLTPAYVLAFSDLCIVQCADTGDWFMGSLDHEAGTALCWSDYGGDLDRAIEGL